jgi:alkylation response protein AidB-like acyl-CoA dehydrogenase
MRLGGMAAAAGSDPALSRAYLWAPCLTIAGGTSEIVRDQVAQRFLGLPRPPRSR